MATDLRIIVTGLRISADLERMGDSRDTWPSWRGCATPSRPSPPELRAIVLQMGQVAERTWAKAGSCIASRDLTLASELETDDDVMDALHRELFTVLLADDWDYGIETAVDVTLCGRYYERFADHAVSAARRVAFLVTGERVPAGRENGLGEYAGR